MEESKKEVFIESKTPWEDIGEGLSRQIVGYNEDVMMVIVKFKKGAIGELHHHIHSQVSYVASGEFEFTIGKKTQVINKGDSFYVSSNRIHGVKCLKEGVLVDVFNPARKDFL